MLDEDDCTWVKPRKPLASKIQKSFSNHRESRKSRSNTALFQVSLLASSLYWNIADSLCLCLLRGSYWNLKSVLGCELAHVPRTIRITLFIIFAVSSSCVSGLHGSFLYPRERIYVFRFLWLSRRFIGMS